MGDRISGFVHRILENILQRTLKVMQQWENTPADMVEIGGGAGFSEVISPKFFKEFCLPYDQRQIQLLHDLNLNVVYHFCIGVMPMFDLVVQTGTDGLETMVLPSMGRDCDLSEASRRVGNKIFLSVALIKTLDLKSERPIGKKSFLRLL